MTDNLLTSRMISDYCRKRIATVLPPREAARLRSYMLTLHASGAFPPMRHSAPDWPQVAQAADIDPDTLIAVSAAVRPAFDALVRSLSRIREKPKAGKRKSPVRPRKPAGSTDSKMSEALGGIHTDGHIGRNASVRVRRKTGVPPKEIVEHPQPLWEEWTDPSTFAAALALHMRRHGDTAWHLHRAVVRKGEDLDRKTIVTWSKGTRAPRSVESMEVLGRIEQRYLLPEGYFKARLPHLARAAKGHRLSSIGMAEQRRLAWHLPDDFSDRSLAEQEEIVGWVRSVIVSGSTDYRRFQAAAMKQRYAVRFRNLEPNSRGRRSKMSMHQDDDGESLDPELLSGTVDAPPQLEADMADLVRFKTATLAAFGLQRNGVWGEETAAQKIEHLGLMFGALAASPRSAVRGFGVPPDHLSFGMLVFPAVWDWYVQWRERRRGFYTAWEVDMTRVAAALTRSETGWLRQTPRLAASLQVIPGLVSADDIETARADWAAACDIVHKHVLGRAREIQRVARVHRDPFEPILPVLEAESPVGEYRKITEEILRLMPDHRIYPRAAAESVRSFLILRLGLHLGVRQKNLRQLMVCPRGGTPRTERQLVDLRRGELRWSERDRGWEVLIPSVAFKNASSSFFGSKPFRLLLPDLGGLYAMIEDYIDRHRRRLLGGAQDPGTFFVKTAKVTSRDAAYDQNTFYEAWRLITQRYGVYNPYTKRGAIKGLLPHGPHNVRDVLATHILKKTGSYEQASYAIQDTPDMVALHYGRFLPQDKSALAAQILNRVWEAA